MTSFNRRVSPVELRALSRRLRNWGTWGPSDELGSLHFLTAEEVRAAARLVRRGRVFSLAIPMDEDGPMRGYIGRENPTHVMTRDGSDVAANVARARFDYTDDAVTMGMQCATQWDGHAHVFFEGRMYNGFGPEHVDGQGAHKNSITNAKEGMVGRGVLLDVPRLTGRPWLEVAETVEFDDLVDCCETQGVEVTQGDIVLVRTGRIGAVRARGSWEFEYAGGDAAGLGVSTATFFADRRVAAVATDVMAFDPKPSQTIHWGLSSPLHVLLIVDAGIHLGEMWDLEALAEDCAQDGVYEFMLVAPPLTVSRAVASPVNPQAIK
jgi:kynurenine formamidase